MRRFALSNSCGVRPSRDLSVAAGRSTHKPDHRRTPAALANRTLCVTPVGELREWNCVGHDTPRGTEEWSAEWSVVVTRRGAFTRRVENDTRLLASGSVSFWNAGESYAIAHPLAGGDRCTVFQLTEATLRTMLAGQKGQSTARPRFTLHERQLDGRAYLLHRHALDAARADVPDLLAVEETMTTFLAASHAGPDVRRALGVSLSSRRHAYAAQEVIAGRFREPITLAEVARSVGCSPFHLARVMRACTGASLHQHVMRLRLREALERLLDEPHEIARIALDAGFASHSHLTTAFGREYGMTPRTARVRTARSPAGRRG